MCVVLMYAVQATVADAVSDKRRRFERQAVDQCALAGVYPGRIEGILGRYSYQETFAFVGCKTPEYRKVVD